MKRFLIFVLILCLGFIVRVNIVYSQGSGDPGGGIDYPFPPPGGGGGGLFCGWYLDCEYCGDSTWYWCCDDGPNSINSCSDKYSPDACQEEYTWCDESSGVAECKGPLRCSELGDEPICCYEDEEMGFSCFTNDDENYDATKGCTGGLITFEDDKMWINLIGNTYPAWAGEDSLIMCESSVQANGGSCYAPLKEIDYYQCNNNDQLELEPQPEEWINPFPNVSRCISSSYDPVKLNRPMCLDDNTCWYDREMCDLLCHRYFFCDEETGTCNYGFFIDIARCLAKHPDGCFDNEGDCFEDCSCNPLYSCGQDTCVGEYCENDCGGFEQGEMNCDPEIVDPGLKIGKPDFSDDWLTPENGRNHICEVDISGDSYFFQDNTVRFHFTLANWAENYDELGVVGISFNNYDDENVLTMSMSLAGGVLVGAFPPTGSSADKVEGIAGSVLEGENRNFFFDIKFLDGFSNDVNFVWLSAVNADGSTLPWTYTGRQFKVWDCEVPVSGAMYDGSGQEAECEANFVDKAGDIFDSLDWRNIDTDVTFPMVVNAPDYESSGNSLDWGFSYSPVFGNLDGDSESVVLKVTDVGGTITCGSFLLNTTETIDPYSTLPSAIVDFALVVNSDPWFQAENGGVQAGGNFSNLIPVTCVNDENCQSVTAIGGLIAAGGDMDKGCTDCSFADPDTWVNTNMVTGNLAYQYFYNEYFVKLGQGTTLANNAKMSDLGLSPTGIYFVDGDFWVDTDNVLTTGEDDYLIIIAKGRIVFEEDAVVSSGIFIADGDIEATGEGDDALTIEGMLFSTQANVELSRGTSIRSINNTSPGVLIRYRPDYLFKLPGEITRVLSGWREN